MDLVGACTAFIHVSDRGSFTLGAAAARIPQPVASRRIAALEKHLGAPLFDRTTRRATLTQFGHTVLPTARRLVDLAHTLEHDAAQARRTPLRLAVPTTCTTHDLARLTARARAHDLHLDPHPAPPAQRDELLHTRQVRTALTAVPRDQAHWTVPLGLATHHPPHARTHYLETLRPHRYDTDPPRRLWLQPEDDTPHIRDPLTHTGDTLGLHPTQIARAADLTTATAEVLTTHDLLLCSPRQADDLDLHWRPIGEIQPTRTYTATGEQAETLRTHLHPHVAQCLGAPTP
ncbi:MULTISPECIES: LysR family transcriptional regulator [unclassified Nocardiopsis]|uniref:LysR family transcriptional regulator n=1 Tax=unclassified Nocardiopsis TaxID=2649073 RepID=UPI0033CB8CE6